MPCVLIVEDDPDTREFMALLLTSTGYETMVAWNGQEALEKMDRRKPCVVLLDMHMPVMDGWSFREAQLQNPQRATVPTIALTGHYDTAAVTERLGVPCLRKPVHFGDVLAAVRHACGTAA